MRTETERKQASIAIELQQILGEDYSVRYDDCESGLTRVYFKPLNKLIREVKNDEMVSGLSITSFTANKEDCMKAYFLKQTTI